MPPSAIARSVCRAISRADAWPVRACSRNRNNSSLGRGNFGASPNPPRRASKASCELPHSSRQRVGAGHARSRLTSAVDRPQCVADRVRRLADSRCAVARRATHARLPAGRRRSPVVPTATAEGSTSRQRTASASGVSQTLIGHPPDLSSPARTSCRRDRRQDAPRDRP